MRHTGRSDVDVTCPGGRQDFRHWPINLEPQTCNKVSPQNKFQTARCCPCVQEECEIVHQYHYGKNTKSLDPRRRLPAYTESEEVLRTASPSQPNNSHQQMQTQRIDDGNRQKTRQRTPIQTIDIYISPPMSPKVRKNCIQNQTPQTQTGQYDHLTQEGMSERYVRPFDTSITHSPETTVNLSIQALLRELNLAERLEPSVFQRQPVVDPHITKNQWQQALPTGTPLNRTEKQDQWQTTTQEKSTNVPLYKDMKENIVSKMDETLGSSTAEFDWNSRIEQLIDQYECRQKPIMSTNPQSQVSAKPQVSFNYVADLKKMVDTPKSSMPISYAVPSCRSSAIPKEETVKRNLEETTPIQASYVVANSKQLTRQLDEQLKLIESIQIREKKQASMTNLASINVAKASMKGITIPKSKQLTVIIDKLKNQSIQYSDPDFPAQPSSLAPPDKIGRYPPDLRWIRLTDLFKNGYLFQEEASLADIMQRSLGDCYLLSTIASMAQHPISILRLFLTEDLNEYGVTGVRLVWRGVPTDIILDDFLIVTPNNEPYSLRTNGEEGWVILLEKAWAKLHGCYYQIEGQLCKEALHDLTGAPTRSFFTDKDPEKLWQQLMDATGKRFIMTAGSKGQDKGINDSARKGGLVGGHAYSLLSTYSETLRGETYRLLKLRNPWGEFEWTGTLADADSIWQNASSGRKLRLGYEQKDDGIFFMTYDDFRQKFATFQICHYVESYVYNGIRYHSAWMEGVYFQFEIRQPGEYYFNVSQLSIRVFDENYQARGQHYSPALLLVIPQSSCQAIVACIGQKRDLTSYKYLENPQQLVQGKYLAYVRIDWLGKAAHSFGLGAYGPAQLEFIYWKGKIPEKVRMEVAKYEGTHPSERKKLEEVHEV